MPDGGLTCAVKLRSAQPPLEARVAPLPGGRARVDLAAPAEAVAPGQACVLYDGDRVLGGGWIERSSPEEDAEATRRRGRAVRPGLTWPGSLPTMRPAFAVAE